MSLHENVSDCFATAVCFQTALAKIARGREDCGKPINAEAARQIARKAMIERDRSWSVIEGDKS